MLKAEYVAGFFDGEGSVGLYAASSNQRYNLRVAINQVINPESQLLFEALKLQFGGSFAYPKRAKEHHNQAISWTLYGDDAAVFLKYIQPFCLLKASQIELCIGWQQKYRSSRAHPHDPLRQAEKLAAALNIIGQLKPLKGRRRKITI